MNFGDLKNFSSGTSSNVVFEVPGKKLKKVSQKPWPHLNSESVGPNRIKKIAKTLLNLNIILVSLNLPSKIV